MKERPIILSSEMVVATIDGYKTMTRRVMNPQPSESWHGEDEIDISKEDPHFEYGYPTGNKKFPSEEFWADGDHEGWHQYCPYGKPGDLIWVRETFSPKDQSEEPPGDKYWYKADYAKHDQEFTKWKSPRFMPKIAARLWLEITGIKVERLQEISREDALSEGIYRNLQEPAKYTNDPVYSFQTLWDSINSKRGFGWNKNPWVWVVKFKIKT